MQNNKMIGKCEWCQQDYCFECSKHEEWRNFCSKSCAKESEEASLIMEHK